MSRPPKKCRHSGKHKYGARDEAVCAAEYLMAVSYDHRLRLFVYRCPTCSSWHLTKSANKGQQPEKLESAG